SCSIYILRAGAMLELTAAHGLNRKALHRSRLKVGEGVVGDVAENARPLVLSDIRSHPNFHFDPDLGEEYLQSFAGTPITRGGNVLGVLVGQNSSKRIYTNAEVETFPTVSMVLAEVLVAEEIIKPSEIFPSAGADAHTVYLSGVTINPGLSM